MPEARIVHAPPVPTPEPTVTLTGIPLSEARRVLRLLTQVDTVRVLNTYQALSHVITPSCEELILNGATLSRHTNIIRFK